MEEKLSIEALLREGKTVKFHPTGTSMFPLFYKPGDYVIVEPVKRRIKKYDVCVYRRENGPLIIHRVYRVKPEGLYFVGDRQQEIEGPLPKTVVSGIMAAFTRNGREHGVHSFFYFFYSRMWMLFRPVRYHIIRCGHDLRRLFNKSLR